MADYPWFKSYDAGVPHTLAPYPDKNLLDVVAETTRQRPDHMMMWFKGNVITYSRFQKYVEDTTRALVGLGVMKGDRVALLLPNIPQMLICQFAAWRAGAIAVPVNPLYSDSELEHTLEDCGAELAIVMTPFYDQLKNVQPRTGVKTVIATGVKEYLAPFKRFIFGLLMEKKQGHYVELRPGDLWLQEVIREYARSPLPDIRPGFDETGLILFSGGTTGVPKGVMLSHGAIMMNGMQTRAWFGTVLTDWEDVTILLMPLFHIYGNIILVSTILNARVPIALVPNPRDVPDLLATIKATKPKFFPAIAPLFVGLMNHPDVKSGAIDFKSMKMCVAAAAPLLPETKKRWEALTGGKLVEAYGLTESGIIAMGPIQGTWKEGAVGLPTPDVEVRIVDIVDGKTEMAPGETGEIIARAPHLMQGYWKNPDATKEMIRDGWLYTGDIGHLDGDGYLYITSRKKEMIKPSGHQVFPVEVEEVIAAHPAVMEVGVAGVKDPERGEAVKAWVVLRSGQQCTAEELKAFCKERLTAYKVPKHVEFRDSLPKSLIGKVLKRVLQEEEEKKQQQ
ncbi:MAG: AMP-binding protein [Syntrophales bacterium]|nr:AMP-binding protein [Syntrophales bacterium]MCK9527303.1 AMP-binding protein [Syntrophales bacterium]MDX9921227.1 AMP-binding protein [Syntrophales bacterium]